MAAFASLAAGGEYLGLIPPDGVTAVSEFGPAYPSQFADESFGFGEPGSSAQTSFAPSWSSPGNFAKVSKSQGSANSCAGK